MKTESFWWWALVIFCASSALNVPAYLIGFLLIGRAALNTDNTNEIMLMAGLCALQFLGAAIGFAFAERIAFRQKDQGRLVIASFVIFPVALVGALFNGLLLDIPKMEWFRIFQWCQNIVFASTFCLLPLTGVAGLLSARRLRRELRGPKPPAQAN